MNRNLENWALWTVVLFLQPTQGSWSCQAVYCGGLRACFLELKAGFKSQLWQLPAVCPWANYLTSLCFSHLVCKNRGDGTTYLKKLLWCLNGLAVTKDIARAGCILDAQYTLAILINTVTVSESTKFLEDICEFSPTEALTRVSEECSLKTPPHLV